MAALHAKGPKIVVISSCHLHGDKDTLHCFVSAAARGAADGSTYSVMRIQIRKVEGHYTGTGDLTTCLMLGWLHKLVLSPGSSTDSTKGCSNGSTNGSAAVEVEEEGIPSVFRCLIDTLATVQAVSELCDALFCDVCAVL